MSNIPREVPRMPTVLTVIGNTGQGKSTVVNDIFGANVCPTGSGADSVTTAIAGWEVADANLIVFDTPGLGDTNGRSEEFFMAITDHLHKHGGVVALVQSQSRMNPILKNRLKALSMILSGSSFTNCCVLITTKYDPEGVDEEHNARVLFEYETRLETELSAIFSQRYAYNKYIPGTREAFVAAIKENISDLEGLKPGEILTWSNIIRLAEGRVKEAVEQTLLLQQQVTQLQRTIDKTKAKKLKYESWSNTILNGAATVAASIGAVATASVPYVAEAVMGGAEALAATAVVPLVATVGTVATVAVGYVVKLSRDEAMNKAEQLGKDIKQLNLQLNDAKKNLKQVDISALELKAREIRRLVE